MNACIDMLYGLEISGAFASHRIARMAEKKSRVRICCVRWFQVSIVQIQGDALVV